MNASWKKETDWSELARKANYSTAVLATLCKISVRQLEREFLRRFRRTPEEWINDLRLHDAEAVLKQGSTVKFTALSLGYKHPPSFSRAFKRYFGVSPSDVRSSLQMLS